MSDLFGRQPANYASAKFPPPRPFQETAHQSLREGVRAGHKNQCVMAPTGSGKAILGMRVIHETLLRGKKAMFVADRRSLINQLSTTADELGLGAHGVIMASHWRNEPSMPFQIASVQTLARREWPDVDVLVIDECHTLMSAWTEHILECRAVVVGLTATAFSPGMGKLFTNLINAATMAELTESGVLVPMRVMSCTKVNMTGAATSGGEWTEAAAGQRGMEIVGDVITEWQKHAENRKTIVFGSTIAHCEEMCKKFNEAGILARMFTSETKEHERAEILAEYKKPDSSIRILISVEALAKGFDTPDVGCVCDVRPLRKSLSTAIQMWGRGLRSSPNTGKKDCLLLDFSGNIIRFADDYSDIFYNGLESLDMGEKLDAAVRKDDDEDKQVKACPSCGYSPMGKRCIACGHERVSLATVEHEAGVMREIYLGKTKLADDRRHLYQQLVTYTRSHGNPETAKGRAAHLFREMTNNWPDGLSYERTPNIEITRAVLNKIRSRNIRFIKGKQASDRGAQA
jgi:superfamily II DNA or RNA helicase